MEIRFRGYDGSNWMYGTAIDFHNETDTWYMLEFGGPEDDWIMVSGVGQYTGIHDKEGKEIYKDDILQEESTGKLFRCEWLDAIASFKLILMTDSKTMFGMSVASRSFTVVGNMYETGEINNG